MLSFRQYITCIPALQPDADTSPGWQGRRGCGARIYSRPEPCEPLMPGRG